MASTSDFRNGLCLEYNNDLYTIVQFQHVKPGKGPAFVRTKLKSLTTGKVIENTFSAGAKVNTARVERRPYQYLYTDDLGLNFMHLETFEQISIQADMIENTDLMKEGQSVEIVVHADTETPLTVDLPPFVELQVSYTEPGEKGNTASTSAQKPAELETGAKINVPLFVDTGEMIKVDTRDRSYSERVRK
ncbi:MAG: elongation factor P [Bacteroidetes bacterium]|nr:MAG: elongation factor P [Bacteroidota bacterium]RLD69857.1 MAG: elongation factor P [Bacteroidota bacterium]RLD90547.1 MAG: elongation factor P [Bacteroidota bacterium]